MTQGRPTKDARLVIGAVIIKHKLCLSDEETVAQIQENPYLQYFVGLADYQMEAPLLMPWKKQRRRKSHRVKVSQPGVMTKQKTTIMIRLRLQQALPRKMSRNIGAS